MNTKIIKGLAIAFSLGIAPGAVFAQTATEEEIKKPQVEGEAATEGEAGAAGERMEGEAGAAAEGEAGVTAEGGELRPEGEAGAAAEGEAATQDQTGSTAQDEEQRPEGEAGTAAEGEATTEGGATAEGEEQRPEGEAGTAAEGGATTEGEAGTAAQGEAETEGGATAEGEAGVSSETTGAVDVTVEQKTQIREVIREVDVQPVDVDFDITVGVAVPQTVELVPLPPRIVEIVPEYEGYLYFVLADGRIIIVDPDSHEIVVIIA